MRALCIVLVGLLASVAHSQPIDLGNGWTLDPETFEIRERSMTIAFPTFGTVASTTTAGDSDIAGTITRGGICSIIASVDGNDGIEANFTVNGSNLDNDFENSNLDNLPGTIYANARSIQLSPGAVSVEIDTTNLSVSTALKGMQVYQPPSNGAVSMSAGQAYHCTGSAVYSGGTMHAIASTVGDGLPYITTGATLLGRIGSTIPGADTEDQDKYHNGHALIKTDDGWLAFLIDHNERLYMLAAATFADLMTATPVAVSVSGQAATYVGVTVYEGSAYVSYRMVESTHSLAMVARITTPFGTPGITNKYLGTGTTTRRPYPHGDPVMGTYDSGDVYMLTAWQVRASGGDENWGPLVGIIYNWTDNTAFDIDMNNSGYSNGDGSAFNNTLASATPFTGGSTNPDLNRTDLAAGYVLAGFNAWPPTGQRYGCDKPYMRFRASGDTLLGAEVIWPYVRSTSTPTATGSITDARVLIHKGASRIISSDLHTGGLVGTLLHYRNAGIVVEAPDDPDDLIWIFGAHRADGPLFDAFDAGGSLYYNLGGFDEVRKVRIETPFSAANATELDAKIPSSADESWQLPGVGFNIKSLQGEVDSDEFYIGIRNEDFIDETMTAEGYWSNSRDMAALAGGSRRGRKRSRRCK